MGKKLGTVTILFKSGQKVTFKVTGCKAARDSAGNLTGITMDGMERSDEWLYLRLDSIDAVLWEA